MSAQKTAKDGQKELDLTGAFDWDNSDALTRLIPNSAAAPAAEAAKPWRPPPSARRLEPTPRPVSAAPPRASAPPPPPPPKPVQPTSQRVSAAPPPLKPAKEPITAFLPPQQLNAAMPSLAAPPGAATPSAAKAKPPVSLVRVASYGLVLLLAAGIGLKALQGGRAKGPRSAASSALAARSADAPTSRALPKARPVIETRPVDAPSMKDAAAAFARGDYREALAHYRPLAKQNPQQQAFQSLVVILERRLAPKAAQP